MAVGTEALRDNTAYFNLAIGFRVLFMNTTGRHLTGIGAQIILLIITGLVVAGCCSTQNEIQHLSTSDLQLRRYELMYCLSMTRMSWDKQPWQSHAYDDVKDDLEEKEAIEREITRRGVTDYHWPPSVTYRYVHDHCHCQCWVATL